MKGQLEDAVKGMGFGCCVILRPALLLGPRYVPPAALGTTRSFFHRVKGAENRFRNEWRPPEWVLQKLFLGMRYLGLPMSNLLVDADE